MKIIRFVDKLDNKECVAISVDGKIKVNLTLEEIAHNDGLSFEDWAAWFKGADTSQDMAIIHLHLSGMNKSVYISLPINGYSTPIC